MISLSAQGVRGTKRTKNKQERRREVWSGGPPRVDKQSRVNNGLFGGGGPQTDRRPGSRRSTVFANKTVVSKDVPLPREPLFSLGCFFSLRRARGVTGLVFFLYSLLAYVFLIFKIN